MARLMGIDLPRNKRVEVALTYILELDALVRVGSVKKLVLMTL